MLVVQFHYVNLLFTLEAADPVDRQQSDEDVNMCNEGNDVVDTDNRQLSVSLCAHPSWDTCQVICPVCCIVK